LSFYVRQAAGPREQATEHRTQQRGELPTFAAGVAWVLDLVELRFI
jgi:hypothetical protein